MGRPARNGRVTQWRGTTTGTKLTVIIVTIRAFTLSSTTGCATGLLHLDEAVGIHERRVAHPNHNHDGRRRMSRITRADSAGECRELSRLILRASYAVS
jgi:hypothetical protein